MTLIVLTVIVIALLVAFLALFLFRIGRLLNRTADDLGVAPGARRGSPA
jgi:hypothetical protein